MKRLAGVVCAVVCLSAGSSRLVAGQAPGDIAQCVAKSTTAAEKSTLIKWMFAGVALNPAVKGMASITDAQRDELSRATGKVFERVLTEPCKAELQNAVKAGGPGAVEASFQVIAQLASSGLFSDPSVSAFMGSFAKSIDMQKLQAVLK